MSLCDRTGVDPRTAWPGSIVPPQLWPLHALSAAGAALLNFSEELAILYRFAMGFDYLALQDSTAEG
jgi:hypothetical protein